MRGLKTEFCGNYVGAALLQTGWDVCWVAVGSKLGELPTKAKRSTSTRLRFILGLTSGDRHSAHTHKLVWERARWVIKVSPGRITASLTCSDKNSKCAYHFHMDKKQEVGHRERIQH